MTDTATEKASALEIAIEESLDPDRAWDLVKDQVTYANEKHRSTHQGPGPKLDGEKLVDAMDEFKRSYAAAIVGGADSPDLLESTADSWLNSLPEEQRGDFRRYMAKGDYDKARETLAKGYEATIGGKDLARHTERLQEQSPEVKVQVAQRLTGRTDTRLPEEQMKKPQDWTQAIGQNVGRTLQRLARYKAEAAQNAYTPSNN